jgi:hypothetical protein
MEINWDVIVKQCESKKSAISFIEQNWCNGVAIYGAGFLGTWAAQYLKSAGAEILYFVDGDSGKWGKKNIWHSYCFARL